jgi:hypothetical protein
MGTKNDTQGRPGKRPCGRERNNGMSTFLALEITASPCTTFSCLPRSELAVAKLYDLLQAGLVSVGFQTCRIAYSLKSAGREVAPAVGLEICVAAAP